jgi:protein-S-isoprenylcysteine O-methyltransferase Ste14
MLRHLDYPPVWLSGFAVAVWAWAEVGLPGSVMPAAWMRVLALMLTGAAGCIMMAALIAFHRARTTVVPHRVPSALVTGGVFRLSRNPIYLADVMALMALALWVGAPGAVILVAGFVRVLHLRFIIPEEARMRAAFGEAYDAFAARTRRWI